MSTECFATAVAGFRSHLLGGIGALLAVACAPAGVPGATPVAELSGTNWRVVQVNGRPTPAAADYSMSFEEDRVGERLGCNHMGGRYRQAANLLTVSDLAQTLMGCPEPASTFESQGGAVLGQPMRIVFTSADRLLLSNAAGSIALDAVT